MLTPRANFLETIRQGGRPDRLVNQFEALSIVLNDPILHYTRGERYRGMPPSRDCWGVRYIWPEDQVAAMPCHLNGERLLDDITRWREVLPTPDLEKNCGHLEAWAEALSFAEQVDRSQTLLTACMPYGVFELLHSFMGFEDTLVNFLLEPEAMGELCAFLGDFRLTHAKLLVEYLHPDAVISYDDWGTKDSLFMSPQVWRTFLKPQYARVYGYFQEQGVVVIHHADSYLAPIAEEMPEIGVNVWQGVLPQNPISDIQRRLEGRMALMGGIDAAVVDRVDATEEEIRSEVRRACSEYGPEGHYIPSLTYAGPSILHPHVKPIIQDEIEAWNRSHRGT